MCVSVKASVIVSVSMIVLVHLAHHPMYSCCMDHVSVQRFSMSHVMLRSLYTEHAVVFWLKALW